MVVMNANDNQLKSPAPFNGAITMEQDIFKICVDSLRTLTNEKYNIKLKAAHAHELVAAYLGYSSKNAMLADTKYPIRNLDQAEIIVSTPDDFIDQRRKNLQELSPDLPDSYTLGEEVYAPLFTDELWTSSYPPFRSFKTLAKTLVENNDAYQSVIKHYDGVPLHHIVDVNSSENDVILNVIHSYGDITGKSTRDGQTTITLPRVSGRIGFGKPKISVGTFSGGARRTLESLGVQS